MSSPFNPQNALIIETTFLFISLVFWTLYAVSNFVIHIKSVSYKKKLIQIINALLVTAVSFQLFWIIFRVIRSTHAPFSGAYESMIFFALLYGIKIFFLSRWNNFAKALLTIPIILLIIGALSLPINLKIINTLVPALQSFWIYIHVPSVFIGYVSLVIGFVLYIVFFIQTRGGKKLTDNVIERLDNEIKIALIFITIGIITGAIWGEQAWGSFWSWDPKETMALVTWIFLVLYFHFRNLTVRFVIVGLTFVAMLVTYFGVMFFTSGLHSYL